MKQSARKMRQTKQTQLLIWTEKFVCVNCSCAGKSNKLDKTSKSSSPTRFTSYETETSKTPGRPLNQWLRFCWNFTVFGPTVKVVFGVWAGRPVQKKWNQAFFCSRPSSPPHSPTRLKHESSPGKAVLRDPRWGGKIAQMWPETNCRATRRARAEPRPISMQWTEKQWNFKIPWQNSTSHHVAPFFFSFGSRLRSSGSCRLRLQVRVRHQSQLVRRKAFFFSCAVHFSLPAPLLRICRAPSLLILGTGPILVIKTVLIPSTRATEEIAPISFPRPLSLEAVIIQSKAILVVEDILVALKSPVAQISISVCPRILDGTESVDISWKHPLGFLSAMWLYFTRNLAMEWLCIQQLWRKWKEILLGSHVILSLQKMPNIPTTSLSILMPRICGSRQPRLFQDQPLQFWAIMRKCTLTMGQVLSRKQTLEGTRNKSQAWHNFFAREIAESDYGSFISLFTNQTGGYQPVAIWKVCFIVRAWCLVPVFFSPLFFPLFFVSFCTDVSSWISSLAVYCSLDTDQENAAFFFFLSYFGSFDQRSDLAHNECKRCHKFNW